MTEVREWRALELGLKAKLEVPELLIHEGTYHMCYRESLKIADSLDLQKNSSVTLRVSGLLATICDDAQCKERA